MDFYSYYKERFTWGHNPYESVAQCQKVVMELMNDHLIPLRISAESATGYLAALYDFAGDGCAVSFPFRIVQNALANAMQRAHDAVEAIDREQAEEAMEDMYADGLIPMYGPYVQRWHMQAPICQNPLPCVRQYGRCNLR